MSIRLICLDADDTLWFNESFFREASQRYVDALAAHASPEAIGAGLYAAEDRNLHVYGYGVKGFTLSMIETALDLIGEALTPATTRIILDIGRDLMRHPIRLIDGVAEALPELARRAPLVVVTKGDLFHQESKVAASGLGDHFSGVEIVSEKTAQGYARVFRRYGVEPGEALMAGNSLRSDIWPALQAGAWAVHLPHEFEWARERADDPEGQPRFRRLGSIRALPAWIDSVHASPA